MASKKRGLSLEEKRSRMLEIFYEKKDVFQLKELEKLGPKEKGVIAQSVKDVVQGLVDDGLVQNEKIGSLSMFWAFPSQAAALRNARLEGLGEEGEALKAKLAANEEALAKAFEGKDSSPERVALEAEVAAAEAEVARLEVELASLGERSPEFVAKLQAETKAAVDEANEWTDDLFATRDWCKKVCGVNLAELDKQLGIPEDLDYVQ